MAAGPVGAPISATEKELIPIILACDTWGSSWQGRRVLCYWTTRSWWPVCTQGRVGRQGSCTCCVAWCLLRPSANATCTQCVYIDTQLITSRMTCPLTMHILSSLRFQTQIPTLPQSPAHSSASSWTARPTGHRPPGAVGSAVLPGGSSHLHAEDL